MSLVLAQSLRMTSYGIAIGSLLSFVTLHVLTSSMYAIRPNDPLIFILVAALVAAISVIAALLPALRAAQIEPLAALRVE